MPLPDRHRVRPPAVAGLFYPEQPEELERLVRRCLAAGRRAERESRAPKAIVAPHAGYAYSGPIAGSAFAALPPSVERVVLLGPAHRVALDGLALPGEGWLETPLGRLEVDQELAAAIASLPQVAVRSGPHAPEHSLEVELPFLQVALAGRPAPRLLPLVVGRATPGEVAEVLEAVWGGAETLVIVSSDLSHYQPYDVARRLDAETVAAVVALAGPIAADRACGAAPLNGLLVVARHHGLEARLLDLRNSGDTAGDRLQVVGYAALHFYERGSEDEPRR
jgi:AmmeMemoRadiSam system protein B